MIQSISATAFRFKGDLIDTTLMEYESKNCGGAKIHKVKSTLCALSCVAQDLLKGNKVSIHYVERQLRIWNQLIL